LNISKAYQFFLIIYTTNKKTRYWAELSVAVEIESSLVILSRLYTTTNYND